MFMYNVWLLAIKESENSSVKFLHVSLLAQYMNTNVVHKSYYTCMYYLVTLFCKMERDCVLLCL